MKKFHQLILVYIVLTVASSAEAFWPWGDKYVAKVNEDIITKDDFEKKLESFHTVKDIGKKMGVDISNVDHLKILNEMIDERLMIQEALRIGLDKTPDFFRSYNLSKLNLSLSRLRREEILNNVKISDEEIRERYIDFNESVGLRYIFIKDKKKGERLLKALKNGEDFASLAEKESETTKDINKKSEDIVFKKKRDLLKEIKDVAFSMKEGETSDLIETKNGFYIIKLKKKKIPEGEIPKKEKKRIKTNLFKEKERERNIEYFASLRKDADITINDSALESLNPDMEIDKAEMTIAMVKGVPIKSHELLRILKSTQLKGEEKELERLKKDVLDGLIRKKLLDIEAESRNYEKEESFKKALSKIKESHLVRLFKIRVIGGTVKLENGEVKKYFEENNEEFREPKKVRFRVIQLNEKERADKAMAELKKGADFGVMAAELSKNRSVAEKGETGWASVDTLDPSIREKLDEMEEGGIYGPFEVNKYFLIVKLIGKRKSEIKKFESVRDSIRDAIRKRKYKQSKEKYLNKLRSASSIKIDESALQGFVKLKSDHVKKK